MRPLRLALLPAAALLLSAAACTPTFASPSEVTDLRILAVRADPPEARFDPGTGEVEQVNVRVLAVDPQRPLPAAATGSACGGDFCVPISLALEAGQEPAPGASYAADLRLPAALIARARDTDKLRGFGGIRVPVYVTVEDGDPAGPAQATKLLLFSPPSPGRTANQAPRMTGLAARSSRDETTTLSLPRGAPIGLDVGEEVGLRPLLEPGTIEQYQTVDLTGRVVSLREQFSYTFHATAPGDLDRSSADEPLPEVPGPPLGLVRLQRLAPGTGSAAPPAAGTLWVVARDGRGGVDWLSARFGPRGLVARPTRR